MRPRPGRGRPRDRPLRPITRGPLQAEDAARGARAAADAVEAARQVRNKGGNRVSLLDRSDSETRELAYDEIWVKQIVRSFFFQITLSFSLAI